VEINTKIHGAQQKVVLVLIFCRTPSLGLATKARGCKVAGQEKNPGVTSHAPDNAKECEGMNPHIPK
jgi:hypothetical protein